jgi:hypothetical protein
MLILKQNAANTVPTPPAGKGTIFLNDQDDLAVKTADGNVATFPTAGGSNTQVYFNDNGSFGATANFTFNKSTNVLTITGNVAATRVLTDNLLYANGTAWDLSDPGGANTQIQFNDDESFGGSAAFVFNKSSNLVTVSANLDSNNLNATTHITSGNVWANSGIIGAQTLKGEGGNISNIQGGNVSGTVSSATTAGTVTTAAQPNITSVGTLSSLAVTGNTSTGNLTGANAVVANFFIGSGNNLSNIQGANVTGTVSSATTAGTVTTAAQPNITSVGTLTSLAVTGNATAGNVYANSGTIGASLLTGTLTTNAQPNITSVGTLTSAAVTGNVTAGNVYANSGTIGAQTLKGEGGNISNIQGGNVSGAVSSATTAGTVTTAAQPNITSVGTLTTLSVTGNISAGNVSATTFTGALSGAATTAGTVTTNSQPNITSVGTLSSLSVTANVDAGNLTTTGVLTVSGTGVSSIAGNLDMTSNTIINLAQPTNDQDAATKKYVDDVAQGLNIHDSCQAATPNTLAVVTGGTITYNNGTAGVGANLTTTGSFNLIDGVNVQTSGTRILVKNEANAVHNGIYTWSNSTVITRATDYNTVPEVEAGDFTFVTGGTLYDNTGWVQTSSPAAIGTAGNDILFTQFSGAGTYTAGTGLTLTDGTVFNISNTTVTAASYGNGDRVASFTVNAQGQLTAASNVVIAANAANLTGTTLASGITTSSLTSVGTLGSLAVTGNATAGNVYANSGTIGASLLTGTLTTAAQPNITSVGTLTSVAITGTATAGNVYANSGTIGASLLTGTLTTAAQPNITSVGTLSSLTVSGNGGFGNVNTSGTETASRFISNVATGTAPLTVTSTTRVANLNVDYANVADNINVAAGTGNNFIVFANAATGNVTELTSTGLTANLSNNSITATTFVGALSGAATSATTAGTVTTAAQPNITSVGTLTSLTSSGNISGANVISSAYSIVSVGTGISGNGTTQAAGTVLSKEFNVASPVSYLNNAVVLPVAVAGMRITIINTSGGDALQVFPAVNGRINSAAANAAYSQPAGARLDYIATTSTQWYTLNATYG